MARREKWIRKLCEIHALRYSGSVSGVFIEGRYSIWNWIIKAFKSERSNKKHNGKNHKNRNNEKVKPERAKPEKKKPTDIKQDDDLSSFKNNKKRNTGKKESVIFRGILAVTGDRQTGVSTSVANLAEMYGNMQYRTLVIDLDYLRRSQGVIFKEFDEE